MPRIIILLADGTGNSAAKLFKTNVWRLYRALDLSDPPPSGKLQQIAYYHDGVGTSSFKPLTLLGGIFGIGLKRNVLDIYSFLCRNYQPGDRIYLFGFSRGAFTARVLANMIASQGILTNKGETELSRYVPDVYRRYRRRYKLPLLGRKTQRISADEDRNVGLVDFLRTLRNAAIKAYRNLRGHEQYHKNMPTRVNEIDFVGVWDTVAAYGLPIDEMTRGIDEWVWPLSMPDYRLPAEIRRARHALSLDDERNTFHPLLWDENGATDNERLQQVWFAGVHSDVGGGYPDDALSGGALEWMMAESGKPNRAGGEGLRFLAPEERAERLPRNDFGPIHNSRSGLGSYYRYQPRRIAAYLELSEVEPGTPRDRIRKSRAATKLIQDPNRNGHGFLKKVVVHESVMHRIANGTDHYAPVVLPDEFEELRSDGTRVMHTLPAPKDADREQATSLTEWVWNDVWRRRVNYFATVLASLLLGFLPLIHANWPPSVCVGPQCVLSPAIAAVGEILPGFVQPWIRAFANAPGLTFILALCILLLLARSASLKRSICDGMRDLWEAKQKKQDPKLHQRGPTGGIYALRSHPAYQRFFQWFKWQAFPAFFGVSVLVGAAVLVVAIIVVGWERFDIAMAERSNRYCTPTQNPVVADGRPAAQPFPTSSKCWASGVRVEKRKRYTVTFAVTKAWEDHALRGRTIPASPLGYESDRLRWYNRPVVVLRRSLAGHWFQPIVKVVPANGRGGRSRLAELRCNCGQGPVYSFELEAPTTGELMVSVNDVMPPVFGRLWTAVGLGELNSAYERNAGEAIVTVTPIPDRP